MANDQAFERVRQVEAKVMEDAKRRERVRRVLLCRLNELHIFSKTFVPYFKGGDAEPIDVERIGVLALAVVEAARAEHAAMVAEGEERS